MLLSRFLREVRVKEANSPTLRIFLKRLLFLWLALLFIVSAILYFRLEVSSYIIIRVLRDVTFGPFAPSIFSIPYWLCIALLIFPSVRFRRFKVARLFGYLIVSFFVLFGAMLALSRFV